MYLLVALAVTLLVVALAWRGFGAEGLRNSGDGAPSPRPQRPARPSRPVAPDDDPDFLNEIDRKLRGEDKSG